MSAPRRKADCHPDRWHYAKGKCQSCYAVERQRAGMDKRSYRDDGLVRVPVKGWGCLA